jgi:DEAD/DEAH box helicase domain-containing protein
MPIHVEDDQIYFGSVLKSICETRLKSDADGWYAYYYLFCSISLIFFDSRYHTHPQFLPYPAKHVSIRGVKELKYTVIDVTRVSRGGAAEVLEEIEDSRVLFEAFEGAVFIHQGLTYLVQEVSHEMRVARVTRADVNWTTSPRHVFRCSVGRRPELIASQGFHVRN